MPSFKTPGEQPAAPAASPATNPVCTLRLELGPHVSGWVNVPIKDACAADLAFLAAHHPTKAGKLLRIAANAIAVAGYTMQEAIEELRGEWLFRAETVEVPKQVEAVKAALKTAAPGSRLYLDEILPGFDLLPQALRQRCQNAHVQLCKSEYKVGHAGEVNYAWDDTRLVLLVPAVTTSESAALIESLATTLEKRLLKNPV